MESIDDLKYEEALRKYADSYVLKKRKTGTEKEIEERKFRYVLYARKSTEDENRQVQSVDDQLKVCKEFAERNNLEIIDTIREEKSAKTAGRREGFIQMLNEIKSGNSYNSILAWHPDRLARNMREAGDIMDLLDKDIILDLKFPSYSFNNDAAGKMTLSILFAMAKEFSDKLSDDTKRGIKKKVEEGKYCGSYKRGYYPTRVNNYYRPDPKTFNLYQQAWVDYRTGKTQKEIVKGLLKAGEKVTNGAISAFFQDPFYAGFYCYGDQVIEIRKVDSKFEPMVSAENFMLVQKANRENPRGWKFTTEFRTFEKLIICGDCGRIMTPGVSEGKGGRYLNFACGNNKCKEKRRESGLKPIDNGFRSYIIRDFAVNFLNENINISEELYRKAKQEYFKVKNVLIKKNLEEIKSLKIKITKLATNEKEIANRLVKEKNEDVAKRLSNDCSIVIKEQSTLGKRMHELEIQNKDFELDLELEFPDFKEFLNFFENAVTTIQTTDNAYLLDQLVKLVFLNMTVSNKKLLKYELREPFKSFENLKFLHGVDNGT